MREPEKYLTEDEYLATERRSEFRSEFLAGEMSAMSGASRVHNRIVSNLVISFGNQFRDRLCNVYSSDLRVKVQNTGLYTYPDVVVTFGEEEFTDEEFDILLNPLVTIEVLSDSTEAYDRGRKFEHYQSTESLSTYILVSRRARRIEHYIRQGNDAWLYTKLHDRDSVVEISDVGCSLRLEDVYAKV